MHNTNNVVYYNKVIYSNKMFSLFGQHNVIDRTHIFFNNYVEIY